MSLIMLRGLALGALLGAGIGIAASPATAQKKTVVGVSWSNFQEERWKTDEAAIKAELARRGAEYISADAQSSPTKQLSDIDSLISRGATALIILAQDAGAIQPAVAKAKAENIPVVGYDRLIEDGYAFYLTFDNREVGRVQAREVFKLQSKGSYVFIKGSQSDPNADFLFAGQMDVLRPAIDKGDIKIAGNQYTDGWLPANAQRNMEQILTSTANKVDAVVASNDGTAGGAIAALSAQGIAGQIPVSGQDADRAALNRIARGTQTVSVWKDSRELGRKAAEVAVLLASGKKLAEIPDTITWKDGPNKVAMQSLFLTPVAITRDNLNLIIEAGWAPKDIVCQGVSGAQAPAACR